MDPESRSRPRGGLTGIVLGALVIIAVIHHFVRNIPSEIRPFAKARGVTGVEIEDFSAGNLLRLQKSGDQWWIVTSTRYTANRERVERFIIKGIMNLSLETVISENAALQFEYSVSTANAIKVSLTGGKKLPVMYIGRPGADYSRFYARYAGGTDTYLASGFGRHELTRPASYFRDRRIISVKESDISNLTISDGKLFYGISRSSAGWLFEKDIPADFHEAVSACRSMSASDFSEDQIARNITIKIIKSSAEETSLWHIGQKVDNHYLASRSGRNDVFKISAVKAEKIIKFLKENGRPAHM